MESLELMVQPTLSVPIAKLHFFTHISQYGKAGLTFVIVNIKVVWCREDGN